MQFITVFTPQESGTASIHDTMDFGYDPAVAEPGPVFVPPRPATLPPSNATVNAELLPPVGEQTTPSCFVWASTYGLATFAAVKAGNYAPNVATLQASPAYTYVKVLERENIQSNTCVGGQVTSCFQFLQSHQVRRLCRRRRFPTAARMFGPTTVEPKHCPQIAASM
ncbi:MAG: hypothetical protein WBE80_06675 [Methylocella sp.]